MSGYDDKCDICIIGGNIAGASLAYSLARKGFDVRVIEEDRVPGKPVQCAGIISSKIGKLARLTDEIVLNRVDRARIRIPEIADFYMSGKERPYVVDRYKLDRSFYIKAEEHGARFLISEKFIDYKTDREGVIIKTSRRTLRSRIIAGCDGPASRVAALNGITYRKIIGVQVRARYDRIPNNVTEMIFDRRWKGLFGWVIPEGNGIARIGLGCYRFPGKKLKLLLRYLGVKNDSIIEKGGGPIPIGYIGEIAFDRTILLGDAACMVKATTGGGIVMLLTAVRAASEAITEAFDYENFSGNFLVRKYSRHPIIKRLRLESKVHYIIRTVLDALEPSDFAEFGKLYNDPDDASIRRIITEYGDMDFPITMALKLLGHIRFLRFLLSIIRKNPGIIRTVPRIFADRTGKIPVKKQ